MHEQAERVDEVELHQLVDQDAAAKDGDLDVALCFEFSKTGPRLLPEHTTVSLLDRLLHQATTVVPTGQS